MIVRLGSLPVEAAAAGGSVLSVVVEIEVGSIPVTRLFSLDRNEGFLSLAVEVHQVNSPKFVGLAVPNLVTRLYAFFLT